MDALDSAAVARRLVISACSSRSRQHARVQLLTWIRCRAAGHSTPTLTCLVDVTLLQQLEALLPEPTTTGNCACGAQTPDEWTSCPDCQLRACSLDDEAEDLCPHGRRECHDCADGDRLSFESDHSIGRV